MEMMVFLQLFPNMEPQKNGSSSSDGGTLTGQGLETGSAASPGGNLEHKGPHEQSKPNSETADQLKRRHF